MKNLFITGGAGFIGQHLCRYLLEADHRITVFDNFAASSRENFAREFSGYLEIIKGDITDKHLLELSVEKTNPDVLIHLAACVSVQESIENPDLTCKINITGTKNVVDAAKKSGVKRIIFASSAAVYGDQKSPLAENMAILNDESYRKKLLSPYAVSKLRAEEVILESTIDPVILRMFNVYGPGQNPSGGYTAVIPEFIEQIQKGENLEVHGDGSQTRDFIYIDDVTKAFRIAIESNAANGIYNLASGKKISILDLISTLGKVYSKKINMDFKPERKGDIRHSCADIEKIKNEMGFIPRVDLEEGIKKIRSSRLAGSHRKIK